MGTLKTVRGEGGKLEFEDGTSTTCDFAIRQTSDAGLRLTCELSPKEALRQWMGGASAPIRLVGTSSDGRGVTLEGTFQAVRVRETAVTFVCSGPSPLRLGQTPTSGGRLACALTNCFFRGTDWVDLPNGASYRGALPVTIGGRLITLQHNRRAEEQRRSLSDTPGTAISARLITDLADAQDRHEALEAMNRLAFLLSLATGTLVSCPRWQLRDFERKLIVDQIGSPPIRSYHPRALIGPDDGEVLKRFLEMTYPTFVAMDPIYQFGKAIHAKIDTAASGFLETRTLTASALIEYLAGIFARENGLLTLLDPITFEREITPLTNGLRVLLSDIFGESLSVQRRNEIASRARWFNEPSLRRKLKFAVERLRLPATDADVDAICNTRNTLVHEMRFAGRNGEAPHQEWTRLIHFIDVMLLRLLGYRGPYVDCRRWETAELG